MCLISTVMVAIWNFKGPKLQKLTIAQPVTPLFLQKALLKSSVYPTLHGVIYSTYLYAPETMLPTQFLHKGKNMTCLSIGLDIIQSYLNKVKQVLGHFIQDNMSPLQINKLKLQNKQYSIKDMENRGVINERLKWSRNMKLQVVVKSNQP